MIRFVPMIIVFVLACSDYTVHKQSDKESNAGVDELIKQSLVQIAAHLDQADLDPARALMNTLRERELADERSRNLLDAK